MQGCSKWGAVVKYFTDSWHRGSLHFQTACGRSFNPLACTVTRSAELSLFLFAGMLSCQQATTVLLSVSLSVCCSDAVFIAPPSLFLIVCLIHSLSMRERGRRDQATSMAAAAWFVTHPAASQGQHCLMLQSRAEALPTRLQRTSLPPARIQVNTHHPHTCLLPPVQCRQSARVVRCRVLWRLL